MIEWFKMRLCGAIRGKWRILDEKEGTISETRACLEVWPLDHDGSVLLRRGSVRNSTHRSLDFPPTVVNGFAGRREEEELAHKKLCNFLCAGSSSSLLPVKPLTAIGGKFRLLCAGFRTEAHRRRRVAEEDLHL
jgi:hypothetical protein